MFKVAFVFRWVDELLTKLYGALEIPGQAFKDYLVLLAASQERVKGWYHNTVDLRGKQGARTEVHYLKSIVKGGGTMSGLQDRHHTSSSDGERWRSPAMLQGTGNYQAEDSSQQSFSSFRCRVQ
ncbi:hypothetical protein HD554DRAFT_2038924 [Boletus coccyginus]|nr:hypothetical protein HD554DRAFT_2038924 [Boletus coccyginus]